LNDAAKQIFSALQEKSKWFTRKGNDHGFF
jgi:hypothetical protein